MIQRFAAVKGSGIFSIDEFCCLTGIKEKQAQTILNSSKLVILLEPGYYLLKPQIKKQKQASYDWNYDPLKQKMIFKQCKDWKLASDIDVGLKYTTLHRYLRAMCRYGNLKKKGRPYKYKAIMLSPLPSFKNSTKKET